MDITIRSVTQEDKAEWFRMRKGIWPEAPDEYLNFDMDELLVDADYAVFFACVGDTPIGLTEVRMNDYAEGCETSPIGYLEGWFVEPEHRGKRVVGVCVSCVVFVSDVVRVHARAVHPSRVAVRLLN